jgi:hypothetical protein
MQEGLTWSLSRELRKPETDASGRRGVMSQDRMLDLLWFWPVPAIVIVAVTGEVAGWLAAAGAATALLVAAGVMISRLSESWRLLLIVFAMGLAALAGFVVKEHVTKGAHDPSAPRPRVQSTRGWRPTEHELRHLDDLRGAVLSGVNSAGIVLNGRVLQGANAEGADLRGASLRGARLGGVRFVATDLRGAELHIACLRGAALSRARLNGADFSGADLRGADMTGSRFNGADFSGADLRGATGVASLRSTAGKTRPSAGVCS